MATVEMSPIVGVRVWYGDGSVADDWESSPDADVQVVAWLHEAGGATWAWGIDGPYTYPPSARAKTGRTINANRFNAILGAAKAALGWGR